MPHLVLYYSPDIERDVDVAGLCRELADCMLEQRDETGRQVFPTGGARRDRRRPGRLRLLLRQPAHG